MSFQIKRSNKSIVVVQRWYDDGKQKEKHIMTIEPYTTPERLNALQKEFKQSKGKIPEHQRTDRRTHTVRLSHSEMCAIDDSIDTQLRKPCTEEEEALYKNTQKRIVKKNFWG